MKWEQNGLHECHVSGKCSPPCIFVSLAENAMMDTSVWVQCVLHQRVSVWHSASMYVSSNTKEIVCVHVHLVVCGGCVCVHRFEAVFMLSCD